MDFFAYRGSFVGTTSVLQAKIQVIGIRGCQLIGPLRREVRSKAATVVETNGSIPNFFPEQQLSEIVEPAAIAMARGYVREEIFVPALGQNVDTAYVSSNSYLAANSDSRKGAESDTLTAPVCMLHGFDSSALEFRRTLPLLIERGLDCFVPDIVGWGFTDYSYFESNPQAILTPSTKREHLYQFWQHKIQRKMVLVGSSLGGSIAVDFAIKHPDAVEALILLSPQLLIEGLGGMSKMPDFLSRWGVRVLRTEWLRESANKMAYYNKTRYATEDARRIGRLHTFLPGWESANVAFIKGGGYSVASSLSQLRTPSIVLWGANDEILPTEQATQLRNILQCYFSYIPQCGHTPHLETPDVLAHITAQIATETVESLDRDFVKGAIVVYEGE